MTKGFGGTDRMRVSDGHRDMYAKGSQRDPDITRRAQMGQEGVKHEKGIPERPWTGLRAAGRVPLLV